MKEEGEVRRSYGRCIIIFVAAMGVAASVSPEGIWIRALLAPLVVR